MMRMLLGFLLGAGAVSVVHTERGRKFASDAVDAFEKAARRELANATGGKRKKKEAEGDAV